MLWGPGRGRDATSVQTGEEFEASGGLGHSKIRVDLRHEGLIGDPEPKPPEDEHTRIEHQSISLDTPVTHTAVPCV